MRWRRQTNTFCLENNDMEEIEVKFLNIDPETIQKKINDLGGKKIFDKLYRRRVFDYPDLRLHKEGAWIRLRDESEQITLTFKKRLGFKTFDGTANDEGMEEVEIIVSEFDKTAEILLKIGLIEKHYIENRRIRYTLKRVEFDIDYYPKLKPFLEIEAKSWSEIDKAINWLGLNPKDKKIFSAYQVYKLNGIEENEYSRITFEEMVKKTK